MARILLPNGATCTALNVWPKNWKQAKASVAKPWYITYRFYWNGKVKLVHIRGMNEARELRDRRAATEILLDSEMNRLRAGYNPITNRVEKPQNTGEIAPSALLLPGLRGALADGKFVKSTRADMTSMLKRVEAATVALGIGYLQIQEVKRRHILAILRECERSGKWSATTFNKFRAYLMTLFKILVKYEAIETNPVLGIEKEIVVRQQRRVLNAAERDRVREVLQKDPELERFVQIFFHSGARLVELCNIRKEDVSLEAGKFLCLVKKGKQFKQMWRVIKDVALPYWQEVVGSAVAGEYLFSGSMKPGTKPGDPSYIAKRWRRLVKEGAGVEVDLYSLKHLNLTEVSAELGAQSAADLAGHAGTAMVAKVYDIGYEKRREEQIRKMGNEF